MIMSMKTILCRKPELRINDAANDTGITPKNQVTWYQWQVMFAWSAMLLESNKSFFEKEAHVALLFSEVKILSSARVKGINGEPH